jgi:predicted  nucleic acid-binding Zn-ribbon protein
MSQKAGLPGAPTRGIAMRIDVHLHDANAYLLLKLTKQVEQIMATQAELVAELESIALAVEKIGTETSATLEKVAELEAALAAAGNVGPEVVAALEAVKAQVAVVDSLVPDSPTP